MWVKSSRFAGNPVRILYDSTSPCSFWSSSIFFQVAASSRPYSRVWPGFTRMKSIDQTDPRVHGRSWSTVPVLVARAGAVAVAIFASPSSPAVGRPAEATPRHQAQRLPSPASHPRGEGQDDQRAHHCGDTLQPRCQAAVEHRADDREELRPGEGREERPPDERGPTREFRGDLA